jgi:asparagine synthase (glutamine-hydrolysing)
MCGIAGFWDPSKRLDAHEMSIRLRCMTDALAHRGPDDEGAWCDPATGIALGHRRLSIIDLSPAGHQPMWSLDAQLCIVFNGEIYNYPALRGALEKEGAGPWRGHSDTEVLLEAIARWGLAETLGRVVGMFAFALWDARSHTLTLARDRIGEKPLYYGWHEGTLLFGSELKAIRSIPGWHARMDPVALASFLHYGYIPAPLSIHAGVRKLAPAHWITFLPDASSSGPQAYWSASEVTAQAVRSLDIDEQEAADQLERLISEAISGQMIADVPLGAFLSGGIDSSLVVALMQQQSMHRVRTFTIGFREADFDEAPFAAAVASHLGTDHTELYVTPREAMAVIPRLAHVYDEPFADNSQIPTILLSQLTRKSVTVSLSGDGGDELFAGYGRYRTADALWRRLSPIPMRARNLLATAMRSVGPEALDRVGGIVRPLLSSETRARQFSDRIYKAADVLALPDLASIHQRMVAHWSDPASVLLRSEASPLHHVASFRDLECGVAAMMSADLVSWLPDDVLAKLDRAAMSVSLETRIPLLDHRIVEFAWRLPLSAKLGAGRTKRLLRAVLERHVPRALFERPKKGFNLPIGLWLRGPLRGWAEELLSEERLRRDGVFDPATVRLCWRQHLDGRRDLHTQLWTVLMFQAWLDAVPTTLH